MNFDRQSHTVLLILTCLGIFFVNLDALYVNIMEARNFITAREMLHDGNWLLTTINGEPRYQKPPLPTWLTAISAALFGLKSLTALRLPAALVTLLLVLVSHRFFLQLTQRRTFAFVGSLILATSFYIVFAGRNGQWDIFTHAFMMVCIYQFYLFFTSEEKKYRRALWAAVFFSLSFMSKGPVSVYALLLPFLLAFGIVYRFRNMKSRWLPLLLFLVVAIMLSGWWHWYTYTFDPKSVAEITQRETANWTGYNVRPFYYYWSFFTQSGVWTLLAFIALLYPYLKNRVFSKKGYQFTILWTILSVVLLSLIPEKKSRYLLPVLIPMAFNTAFYVEYLFRNFKLLTAKLETYPVYLNFGLIALIGLVFPLGGYIYLCEQLDGYWVWFVLLSVALFLISIFMLRSLFQRQIQPVFYLTIAFIVAIMCLGLPMAKALTVNPSYKPLSELRQWKAEQGVTVYEMTDFSPEMVWDYGEPIPILERDGTITIPKAESFGVLVAENDLPLFHKTFSNYTIEKVMRFDMNPKAPGDRSHKVRLWRDLYLVSR
ncbi:MAG: hypothetical protein CMC08_04005 [Flavobacteriaceae bacterium]|nr:hypothetical protein [Flavobacteriaceae bacterium]